VFSISSAECSRFPVPSVLGYPDRVCSVSCARRSRPPASDQVFSVSSAECSRFPVPSVLGYPDRVCSVSCAERSRPPAPDRVFSVSSAECSRFPVPSVLGYPDRVCSVSCAGHSRPPAPDRVFSVSRAGRSRLPDLDRGISVPGERVTPRHISPGLQRGQLTVTSLQLQTQRRVSLGERRPGNLDHTHSLSTARLTSRLPPQRGQDHLDLR